MTTKKKEVITVARIKSIYALLENSNLQIRDINRIKENEALYMRILNEALTHTSTNLSVNHERLEFHGDAVLRLAASEYIQIHFPKLKVGDRSALRAQLVSDEWLAKLGYKIRIKEAMLIAPKALKDAAAIAVSYTHLRAHET